MMAVHNKTGNDGEQLAVDHLKQEGFIILHRNWRHKNWEVDVIASKNNRLHIIEVKTRSSAIFGHPEEALDDKKMQYLINAAEEYMYQNPQWKQLQFDVLSITIRGKEVEYYFIEDIYL